MSEEKVAQFKTDMKDRWASFHVFENRTTIPAGHLVEFAEVVPDEKVLDIGCGTGVAAVSAARRGAKVSGLDLTPALLEHARRNSKLAEVDIEFTEGDAESLPYGDGEFDVVLSQFGHIFAPRPHIAVSEMLRVLRSGGRVAFSTWPPNLYTGLMFSLVESYLPPPDWVESPAQWGERGTIKERLGDAVTDLMFEVGIMQFPTLSPKHALNFFESGAGPVAGVVEKLKGEPERLGSFRCEMEGLIAAYMKGNALEQQYLMARAKKL